MEVTNDRGRRFKRRLRLGLAAAVVSGLAMPAGASASGTFIEEVGATAPPTVGSSCVSPFNFVQHTVGGDFDYTVSTPIGVITLWRHQADEFTAGSGGLQVWRPAGGTNYTYVGGSAIQNFTEGELSQVDTRVPVRAGDVIGLRSEAGESPRCHFPAGLGNQVRHDGAGATAPAAGALRAMSTAVPLFNAVNVSARVEPDVDADGFGDSSQDNCDQIANPDQIDSNGDRIGDPCTLDFKFKLGKRLPVKKSGFPVKISCSTLECDFAAFSGKAVAKAKVKNRGGRSAAKLKKAKFKFKTRFFDDGTTFSEKKVKLKLKNHKKAVKELRKLLKKKAFRKGSKLEIDARGRNVAGDGGRSVKTAKLKS